jgi:hypothetical protein
MRLGPIRPIFVGASQEGHSGLWLTYLAEAGFWPSVKKEKQDIEIAIVRGAEL